LQFSAHKAGIRTINHWFSDYAILGDDIVIANDAVAKQYLKVLDRIGVKCGIHKSLVSPKGLALEFAKRFLYKGVDMSPVPIKEILASCETLGASLEAARKYSLSESSYMYLLGYRFKALSRLAWNIKRMPKRFAIAILSYRLFVSQTMFEPIPAGWLSVGKQRRIDVERNVLNSFVDSLLVRTNRMFNEALEFPKYFGDSPEDSSLGRGNPDFMEGDILPVSLIKKFIPEDSDWASKAYGEDYWNETKVDGELWMEQTYRMFYQQEIRRVFVLLLDLKTELETKSSSDRFDLQYTRLLMIDKSLSEINRIIFADKIAGTSTLAGKPHLVV